MPAERPAARERGTSIRVSTASTTRGSNWVPEFPRNSATAHSGESAVR